MALNLKLSNATADVQGDATAPLFNNGYQRVYSGAQPTTSDTAIGAQVLLAEARFAAVGIATSVNGLLTANPLVAGSKVLVTGLATWFRNFRSDGVTVINDGAVGSTATGDEASLPADCVISNRNLQQNADYNVTSFTHTVTK